MDLYLLHGLLQSLLVFFNVSYARVLSTTKLNICTWKKLVNVQVFRFKLSGNVQCECLKSQKQPFSDLHPSLPHAQLELKKKKKSPRLVHVSVHSPVSEAVYLIKNAYWVAQIQ